MASQQETCCHLLMLSHKQDRFASCLRSAMLCPREADLSCMADTIVIGLCQLTSARLGHNYTITVSVKQFSSIDMCQQHFSNLPGKHLRDVPENYYRDVPATLQWCSNNISGMFQYHFSDVPATLQGCYSNNSVRLQQQFRDIPATHQGCPNDISWIFQYHFRDVPATLQKYSHNK